MWADRPQIRIPFETWREVGAEAGPVIEQDLNVAFLPRALDPVINFLRCPANGQDLPNLLLKESDSLAHALQHLALSSVPTCVANYVLAYTMRSTMKVALKKAAAKEK